MTTNAELKACRESFEKWFKERKFFEHVRHTAWEGWQAAWKTRAPESEAVAWDVLPERVVERRQFNDNMATFSWTPQQAVLDALRRLWAIAPEGGSYRELLAITANETAKSFTHPRATSNEVKIDAASLVKSVQKDAQSVFEEYVLANYPDGCVIARASWHAPRLFRAAVYAIDAAMSARGGE